MFSRQSNIIKTDAKAIREGYLNGRMDGKDFFYMLREAIKQEYLNQGYCDYLEDLLLRIQKGMGLYIIEYAVIEELYEENNTDPYVEKFVPYIVSYRTGSRYTWDMKNVMQVEVEEVKKIMRIKSTWRRKHQRRMSQLLEENEKLKMQLQHVTDESETFPVTDLEDIEAENAIHAENEEAAKAVLDEYFEKRLQEQREEFKKWEMEFSEKDIERAEMADVIHGQMCDETNAVQAQFGSKLNETIESLRDIESAFFSKIYSWQKSLYPRDMEPIGRHYINLYNALNLDKLIKAEAVFQMNQGEAKPSMETVEALEKLEIKLQKLLKKYERALQGLGLYVQFPQEGEPYDDVLYSCSLDPVEPAVITKCISPAVIHKMEGAGNEKTVIKAEVEVRITGKEAISHEYYNV